MELTKYKITAVSVEGYALVIYNDNQFKSFLNEFKAPLNDTQLNAILNHITADPKLLAGTFDVKFKGRLKVEHVKAIGTEPETIPEYAVNEKAALFCELYEAAVGVKYKIGGADIGKLKALVITPDELRFILGVYMTSDEWFLKPKSVANFIKKFNEIRAIAYAKPKKRVFPLPYSDEYFNGLSLMDKRLYHAFLKENGYEFQQSSVRGSKWILKN